MARFLRMFGATATVLSIVGCTGDRVADRTLKIHQVQSTETYGGQFQIDASQLPPDAIERSDQSGGEGSPVTSLTLRQDYPIRVVLVPANDDGSAIERPNPENRSKSFGNVLLRCAAKFVSLADSYRLTIPPVNRHAKSRSR